MSILRRYGIQSKQSDFYLQYFDKTPIKLYRYRLKIDLLDQGWAIQLMSGAIDWRPQITWGRQYNSSKIFKYQYNIYFQYFKVISEMQFF